MRQKKTIISLLYQFDGFQFVGYAKQGGCEESKGHVVSGNKGKNLII